MNAQIRESDVDTLCMRVMDKLIQKTQKDETVSVNKDSLYEEACAGSPGGIGDYDPTNVTLKNRVFQELFGRGYIKQGNTPEEIRITYRGKNTSLESNLKDGRTKSTYVLYIPLAGDSKHKKPNWNLLAKKYGFNVVRDRSTLATIEASPDIVASLQKDHPEIQVTAEKKYHTTY